MNTSSDVVAIESTGSRRDLKFRTNFKPKKQYKRYPYFVDPQIVPRVKQYLEDNKHKVYVNVDEMVADLRRRYRDYSNKKHEAFKKVVEKAFSVVLQTYGMTDQDAQPEGESDSSDISAMDDDSEDLDLIIEKNQTNRQLVNIYMQKKGTAAMPCLNTAEGKELIDISSDDEEVNIQTPSKKAKLSESQNHNDGKQSTTDKNGATNSVSMSTNLSENHKEATQDDVASNMEVSKTSVVSGSSSTQDRPKRKRQMGDNTSATVTGGTEATSQRKGREVPVTTSCKSFQDVGGCSKVLEEVCKLLVHIRHPEIFEKIGISPLRGFLLHGPPGCGKTLLANAIAGELEVPLLKVSAPELVAGVSGESEERIRDLFDQALSLAPCVLFLDEIDAITPNRNNAQREMERRIVAQLLTSLDELGEKEGGNRVLVLGATNRPDSLDPALRRAGRFDREVCMGIPDREARAHILRVVCHRLALAPEVDSEKGIQELANLTPGFVGADLTALAREAAMCAVNRIFSELKRTKAGEKEVCNSLIEEMNNLKDSQNEQELELEKNNISDKPDEQCTKKANVEENSNILDKEKHTDLPEVVEDKASDTIEAEVVGIEVENSTNEDVGGKDNNDANSSQINNREEQIPGNPSEDLKLASNEVVVEVMDGVASCEQPSSDSSVQEVLVVSSESKEEKKKNESDRECNATPMEHSNAPSGSVASSKEVATASEQTVQKMTLSQKLIPIPTWNPELCQLLSWLRETPVLTPAQLSKLSVTMEDFHEALHNVQPSAKREGFATVPDVTWDDVGSLSSIREELQLAILAPVRYSGHFSKLGLNVPTGVLLCGPPGCGKTLLAKAIANEAGINFISVKGPELLNMYVGESERAVRQVFQRARNSAPCVIFFDELDALCPKRSDTGDNGVSSRVVNQLLTEMDGVEGRSAVFLMAASNRPDIIDPAVLRPGRLDKVLYVGLPTAEDRIDILKAVTKNRTRPLIAEDVDLAQIARSPNLEGYTGADLAALVREAGVQSLQEFIRSNGDPNASINISLRHFISAMEKIRPSVTEKDQKHYEKLRQIYSSNRSTKPMDTM